MGMKAFSVTTGSDTTASGRCVPGAAFCCARAEPKSWCLCQAQMPHLLRSLMTNLMPDMPFLRAHSAAPTAVLLQPHRKQCSDLSYQACCSLRSDS